MSFIVDAVLTDVQTPVMDGQTATRTLRQTGVQTPIIALTGNAANYSMDDFKSAGINDYLPKPINFDELVSKVKDLTE